jgi:hypothetical protein
MILMVKCAINTVGLTLSSLYIMYIKNGIKIHTENGIDGKHGNPP